LRALGSILARGWAGQLGRCGVQQKGASGPDVPHTKLLAPDAPDGADTERNLSHGDHTQGHPHLLRGLFIDRPNQVWAMYVRCILAACGFISVRDHGLIFAESVVVVRLQRALVKPQR
jgi:hypothetical protein